MYDMRQIRDLLGDRRDRGFHPRRLVLLVGAMVSASCGGEGVQEAFEAQFDEWDSAGIRIAENPAHVLEHVLPWVVDTVPDLELGQVEGEGPSRFHRIRGVLSHPDGGLIVVDAGSQELRWFDRAGEHRLRVGGEGDGPGEFRDPLLVPQFDGDPLLVFDTRARRFTWVAKDGSGFRAHGPLKGGGRLIAGAATAAAGSRVLFRSASGDCLMEDYCESSLSIRWVDPTQGLSDTIAQFPRRYASTTELGDLPYLLNGPFDPVGVAAMGPRGPVIGGGTEFELREFDAAGRLDGIFRVHVPARKVTDQAIARVVQRYAEQGYDPKVMRGIFARMSLPDALPAFQSLAVDRVGWYWAELFRLDDRDPSAWLVFDQEGRAHGVVELPEDLEVHEIGPDYVLGRWVDDLGVEYVRRYGLRRTRRTSQ